MQLAGSLSWRLEVTDSQPLDTAIFMRDAARLSVPQSSQIPPPRGGDLPDHSALLPEPSRVRAGQQWLWWWRSLLAFELDSRTRRQEVEPKTWAAARMQERRRVFDPPTFASIRRWPELHAAAVTAFEDMRACDAAFERPTREHDPTHIDWSLTRDIADAVIAERGVSPDQLDATVLMVDLSFPWFHGARPGMVICSTGLNTDRNAMRALLRQAFTSGIEGTAGR